MGIDDWRNAVHENDPKSWFAWLLERERDGRTEYMTYQHSIAKWVTDPLEAIHFVRRRDADLAAEECEDCLIRQHEFVGDPK